MNHAINIAPEFGVIESKCIYDTLKKNNLKTLLNDFIEISYNSKKWQKWMRKESETNKTDKAIISGHYVFQHLNFKRFIRKQKNI